MCLDRTDIFLLCIADVPNISTSQTPNWYHSWPWLPSLCQRSYLYSVLHCDCSEWHLWWIIFQLRSGCRGVSTCNDGLQRNSTHFWGWPAILIPPWLCVCVYVRDTQIYQPIFLLSQGCRRVSGWICEDLCIQTGFNSNGCSTVSPHTHTTHIRKALRKAHQQKRQSKDCIRELKMFQSERGEWKKCSDSFLQTQKTHNTLLYLSSGGFSPK